MTMRFTARRSRREFLALLGPALGLARAGYDDFVQWTRKRYLTYTQLAIAQHVPVQIAIARIAAQIDAAELLARRALFTARQDYAGMSMERFEHCCGAI